MSWDVTTFGYFQSMAVIANIELGLGLACTDMCGSLCRLCAEENGHRLKVREDQNDGTQISLYIQLEYMHVNRVVFTECNCEPWEQWLGHHHCACVERHQSSRKTTHRSCSWSEGVWVCVLRTFECFVCTVWLCSLCSMYLCIWCSFCFSL